MASFDRFCLSLGFADAFAFFVIALIEHQDALGIDAILGTSPLASFLKTVFVTRYFDPFSGVAFQIDRSNGWKRRRMRTRGTTAPKET